MEVVLNRAQWSLLTYVAHGLSNEDIGDVLGITEEEVESTVCELMKRLGFADRLQLVLFVYSHWYSHNALNFTS